MSDAPEPLWGLIPAAGKGSRAAPYTENQHKALLAINGMPNIERIIAIMRDDLAIKNIVIVIGHLGEQICQHLGDGSRFHVHLHYVENTDLDKGWAWSVLLSRQYIATHFCIMLCDECYLSANHAELLAVPWREALFTCASMKVDDAELIRKNYALIERDGVLQQLQEKPVVVSNDAMGTGTFICSPKIFPCIEQAYQKSSTVDFVTLLNDLLQAGERGQAFSLTGTYVNINDRDSLALARYHDRNVHFSSSRKALLIYAEGDEENIAFTIERYRELSVFDEIFVVLPEQNLLLSVVQTMGVSAILCPTGCVRYGEKLHYAIKNVQADIIALTEADYSFSARDISKLFAYLCDADMVIGTRTTRQLIEQDSTMRGLLRMAHTALGKLVEMLWWDREARFTDAGCTLRVFWRSTWDAIAPELSARGPEFSAEMMIACLDKRLRVIEIPVNYFNRSASQIRAYRNPRSFWSFVQLIFRKRFQKKHAF